MELVPEINEVNDKLVVLFQQMADLTNPECGKCLNPYSCCDGMYCHCAEEYARDEWGIELRPLKTGHPTIPFLGENGCVVAPHLRPLCTLHTCDINGIGVKKGDPEWTAAYFKLREQIEELDEVRCTQTEETDQDG
jgi:hypothetical protein